MNRTPEERRLRIQLANLYHLVDYFKWTELIFSHISAKLPGPEHRYLVNPFGLNYREVTPENLLIVDVSGELVEASEYPANPAGFALHGAIHASRPDVHCIMHTHTNPLTAVAMKEGGFDHNNFYGAQLFGRVGYHDFEGITLYEDERPRMVSNLGDKSILILRNHGIAVCERDIPTTFMLHWIAQRAAEIQCHAGMIPGPDVKLSQSVIERCGEAVKHLVEDVGFAKTLFDAQVRQMRSEEPKRGFNE